MSRPPYDPRLDRRTTDEPTLRGILATTAVVLSVPLLLWAAANPLAATLSLAVATGAAVAVRRAVRLRRCLAECGGVAVDLWGDRRLCIARQGSDPTC